MNIYIANLSFNVTDEDLRELFSPYGTINSVKVIIDKETGKSKGFGFVEMPNEDEGQKAIDELNGTTITFEQEGEEGSEEKVVKVSVARPRQQNNNQGGFRQQQNNNGFQQRRQGFNQGFRQQNNNGFRPRRQAYNNNGYYNNGYGNNQGYYNNGYSNSQGFNNEERQGDDQQASNSFSNQGFSNNQGYSNNPGYRPRRQAYNNNGYGNNGGFGNNRGYNNRGGYGNNRGYNNNGYGYNNNGYNNRFNNDQDQDGYRYNDSQADQSSADNYSDDAKGE